MFTGARIFIILFLTCYAVNYAKKVDKCENCSKLVESFIKNLDKTSKGNFGGGNTDWEDRKLGDYLYSETRFEEIVESICDSSECYKTLEEYEDYLFDWFKNKQNLIKSQLNDDFCVNILKACCQKDHYGPNCDKCPFNLNKVCSDNGYCDGSGTRKGNGKCKCNEGYTDDLCNKCSTGYYEEENSDIRIKCNQCDQSCKTACLKSGPDGCVDCKEGWIFNNGQCEDINECLNESVCGNTEYCENQEGSYRCKSCDETCDGCYGPGVTNCKECKIGFEKNDNNECIDINECERNSDICGNDEPCENTYGSYSCKGFEQLTNTTENQDDSNVSEKKDEL